MLDPALERPSPLYLRAFYTFVRRTKTSGQWTDYVFSQPLDPPLTPPLPVPQQPANNAHALARLRRCMMERKECTLREQGISGRLNKCVNFT